MVLENQKDYWDTESGRSFDYCKNHYEAMQKQNILNIFSMTLKKYNIDIENINKCLEIGGGSQILSRFLCSINPKIEVICTDVSSERINAFASFYGNNPNNLTLLGNIDAQKLPFKDKEFDLIIGEAMLHHIDNFKSALLEINRTLKDNSNAIFLREPTIGFFGLLFYKLSEKFRRNLYRDNVCKNIFEFKKTLEQWKYEFLMSGFSVKILKKWSNQGFIWKIRNCFPSFFPAYIGFLLKKEIDIDDLLRKE